LEVVGGCCNILRKYYHQMVKMPEKRDDEDIEIIDIIDRGWLERALGDLSKASVAKQITVGGVSGWCAGYIFSKVGKAAAAALGGSLLILQVAHHKGYIKINWGQMEKDMNKAKKTVQKDTDKLLPYIAEEVRDFTRENMFVAGGFAGGFLIGLAS